MIHLGSLSFFNAVLSCVCTNQLDVRWIGSRKLYILVGESQAHRPADISIDRVCRHRGGRKRLAGDKRKNILLGKWIYQVGTI